MTRAVVSYLDIWAGWVVMVGQNKIFNWSFILISLYVYAMLLSVKYVDSR